VTKTVGHRVAPRHSRNCAIAAASSSRVTRAHDRGDRGGSIRCRRALARGDDFPFHNAFRYVMIVVTKKEPMTWQKRRSGDARTVVRRSRRQALAAPPAFAAQHVGKPPIGVGYGSQDMPPAERSTAISVR
jgi:hypothetical protein